MFTIILKNNSREIEIITTRALLAIAGVASFLFADKGNYYTGMAFSVMLFLASFFVKTILERYKVNRLLFLSMAALLTYFSTWSVGFAVLLIAHGIFFQLLNKKIIVELGKDAIVIHNTFSKKKIAWNSLSNVVLKDRILTLDFKNDRLLQSEIGEESFDVDEQAFNSFCSERLDK